MLSKTHNEQSIRKLQQLGASYNILEEVAMHGFYATSVSKGNDSPDRVALCFYRDRSGIACAYGYDVKPKDFARYAHSLSGAPLELLEYVATADKSTLELLTVVKAERAYNLIDTTLEQRTAKAFREVNQYFARYAQVRALDMGKAIPDEIAGNNEAIVTWFSQLKKQLHHEKL